MHTYFSDSEAQTQELARNLAKQLRVGQCVTLQGEVGAGKTVFARALIRALYGSDVQVNSPTFTLVQTYPVTLGDGQHVNLWHYDLYRLKHPDELYELGLDEALDTGVMVMEWAAIALDALPMEACVHVRVRAAEDAPTASECTRYVDVIYPPSSNFTPLS
jgi:tRNA threonylcarbamoyladenosine biosynthesis protein TsaE